MRTPEQVSRIAASPIVAAVQDVDAFWQWPVSHCLDIAVNSPQHLVDPDSPIACLADLARPEPALFLPLDLDALAEAWGQGRGEIRHALILQ